MSFFLTGVPGFADVPINTIHTGTIIPNGTYFNTAGNVTAFRNPDGGLWLKSGTTLRGFEVTDASGKLTNNGGTIQLYAPGSVIRIDGDISVRGVQNPSTHVYVGNGGNIFINAAYLYQSGHIYANGVNGGLVQADVGSMTMTNGASITANGFGGKGGVISLNASGPVDLQRGSLIDTSGQVSTVFDTNVINIEGSLVNLEGTLQANGVNDRGGTIRLVSTGQTDLTQSQVGIQRGVQNGIFSSALASSITNRESSLKTTSDGDTTLAGTAPNSHAAFVFTQGTGTAISSNNDPVDPVQRSGDGGTIIVMAQRNITNAGSIGADGARSNIHGGNGGTISLNTGARLSNSGFITANGGTGQTGGSGGLIAMSYVTCLPNTQLISAQGANGSAGNGGNGGLIDLVSTLNPSLNGTITASRGLGSSGHLMGLQGSVVAPDPVHASNTLIGIWRRSQPIELLTNAENYILLSRRDVTTPDLMLNAQIRSLADQAGTAPQHIAKPGQFDNKLQLYVFDVNGFITPINSPTYFFRNVIFSNASSSQAFTPNMPAGLDARGSGARNFPTPFNTMTLLSAGSLSYDNSLNNLNRGSEPFMGLGIGGGHFTSISTDFSADHLYIEGVLSGGSVNIAASHSIANGGGLEGSPFVSSPFSGGSFIEKAPTITRQAGVLSTGGLMGGSIQLIAKNSIESGGAGASGNRFGGSLYLQVPLIQGANAATGDYGGFIETKGTVDPNAFFNVSGQIQNGKIVHIP